MLTALNTDLYVSEKICVMTIFLASITPWHRWDVLIYLTEDSKTVKVLGKSYRPLQKIFTFSRWMFRMPWYEDETLEILTNI